VLDKLVETLLRTAIEHAGAERGVLIEPRGEELWVRAEGSTSGSAVPIVLRDVRLDGAALPESVVRYAARVHETVNLDDASAQGGFSNDEYIRREHAKSVLCLPLVQQGRLMAVLYLENNLAARVFTPARMAVLNVLAAQAAMSLEKSRLFRELQQREAKIRRLFEANIIGIFIYHLDGRITDANDAFLRIVGYDRDDLVSGRLRWTDLTPPEWLERDQRIHVPQIKTFGVLEPFEKEFFRKDGSRVPVLVGGANFEDHVGEGVAFVLDLTERKRAEDARTRAEEEREKLRVRHLAREFELTLEARVAERIRIARELHDTLLQSFNSAFLRFALVEKLLATRPDEAREMLHSAMNEARAAITEGRQSVQGLRSSVIETNDLSESICNLAQQLGSESTRGAATEVRLNVIGTPRALRPLVRDEIYRITGEALRNAFRHAEASRIEVQLEYDARRFELRVRDDGKGIDSRVLADTGRPGHFGLPGMRERAQQLGGELTVWSAPESGTEIALTVPGARAYDRARRA
jgi:PAS domain S-box-containing protein